MAIARPPTHSTTVLSKTSWILIMSVELHMVENSYVLMFTKHTVEGRP